MKLILFFAFAFSALCMNAQQHTFMVYSVKGNVTVNQNKTDTKAHIGNLLEMTASINVPNGSVITFICDQVGLFTINKPGKYSVSTFKDSCKQNSNSITANYLRYVWAQMSHGSATPSTSRKLFMNTVGAVSRSVNNIWIDPRLDTIIYASGSFPLSWKSYAEAKDFEFSLFTNEKEGQPIFVAQTEALQLPLTSLQKTLNAGNTYYWTASIRGEQNDERKVIKVVNSKERDEYIASLRKSEDAFETEAEEAFRLGFQLEESHYLADAYGFYQKAAELQPAVALYRSTLMAFRKDYDVQ
jgi:hypothetical protein